MILKKMQVDNLFIKLKMNRLTKCTYADLFHLYCSQSMHSDRQLSFLREVRYVFISDQLTTAAGIQYDRTQHGTASAKNAELSSKLALQAQSLFLCRGS